MVALSSIISKSVVENLNRLENVEYNRFSWNLMRRQDSLSLIVMILCSLRAKKPNKAKDDSEVTEHVTVKPVKRHRKKKKSPSALAHSRERYIRFLKK